MKNEIVTFVTEITETDSSGFVQITGTESNDIFAEIKSVRQSEFYQAAAANVKVSIVAVINYDDWIAVTGPEKKTPKIYWDGMQYKVVRVYREPLSIDIELTLQEVG